MAAASAAVDSTVVVVGSTVAEAVTGKTQTENLRRPGCFGSWAFVFWC
jgi:hypothetical protein